MDNLLFFLEAFSIDNCDPSSKKYVLQFTYEFTDVLPKKSYYASLCYTTVSTYPVFSVNKYTYRL